MPPNPPSNSRLPRLVVWSGYGTALGLARRSLRSPLEMKSFSLVMATTSRGGKNKPCKMSVFPRRPLVSLSKRGTLLGLLRRTVQTSTVAFQVQVR